MYDRKPNLSFPWLVAGAVAAFAAVATPVAAFERSAHAQEAQKDVAVAAHTAGLPVAERTTTTLLDSQEAGTVTITSEGVSHHYIIDGGETYRILDGGTRRSLTAEERREGAGHRRAEAEARAHMREQEAHMREQEAQMRGQEAHIRGQEAHMREQEALLRDQMAAGANQMASAAQQMREEADRLGDPAYRARQIEEKRSRGQTVTDQQLIDAITGLRQGADQMERQAAQMRVSSRQRD